MVCGLGKGGSTYFAIDATDTAVTNEAQAAAKVLWEFALPYSEFSFGEPVIAKTRTFGWVVVVASGYNNVKAGGDGKGHLYMLPRPTPRWSARSTLPARIADLLPLRAGSPRSAAT